MTKKKLLRKSCKTSEFEVSFAGLPRNWSDTCSCRKRSLIVNCQVLAQCLIVKFLPPYITSSETIAFLESVAFASSIHSGWYQWSRGMTPNSTLDEAIIDMTLYTRYLCLELWHICPLTQRLTIWILKWTAPRWGRHKGSDKRDWTDPLSLWPTELHPRADRSCRA